MIYLLEKLNLLKVNGATRNHLMEPVLLVLPYYTSAKSQDWAKFLFKANTMERLCRRARWSMFKSAHVASFNDNLTMIFFLAVTSSSRFRN